MWLKVCYLYSTVGGIWFSYSCTLYTHWDFGAPLHFVFVSPLNLIFTISSGHSWQGHLYGAVCWCRYPSSKISILTILWGGGLFFWIELPLYPFRATWINIAMDLPSKANAKVFVDFACICLCDSLRVCLKDSISCNNSVSRRATIQGSQAGRGRINTIKSHIMFWIYNK